MHVLLVDNYDSFTWNLVQAFRVLGARVDVIRNDAVDPAAAVSGRYTHVAVSPGPGRPERAGRTEGLVAAAAGRVPLLGVCLGHQAIATVYGSTVVRSRAPMHGKRSAVRHDGRGLFAGLPSPLVVGRYHSLSVDEATLPPELEVTARAEDGEIMALAHAGLALFGVQFHPESILTPDGPRLLANFLAVREAGAPARALRGPGSAVP